MLKKELPHNPLMLGSGKEEDENEVDSLNGIYVETLERTYGSKKFVVRTVTMDKREASEPIQRSPTPEPEYGHHAGIPVGPALAGWVETLQLPPEIKREACAMFRHRRNQVITTGSREDLGSDTIYQFVVLLQRMYKMKMQGRDLPCLKTLTPIFLLLANKL